MVCEAWLSPPQGTPSLGDLWEVVLGDRGREVVGEGGLLLAVVGNRISDLRLALLCPGAEVSHCAGWSQSGAQRIHGGGGGCFLWGPLLILRCPFP